MFSIDDQKESLPGEWYTVLADLFCDDLIIAGELFPKLWLPMCLMFCCITYINMCILESLLILGFIATWGAIDFYNF